jgi:polyvinyl alcohol dehydrogenase (cytochrome)
MKGRRERIVIALLGITAVIASAQQPPPDSQNAALASFKDVDFSNNSALGFLLFRVGCTRCHGNAAFERAPSPATLMQYPPERIYQSLTTGTMANVIGNQMSDAAKRAVSESLAGRRLGAAGSGDADAMPNRCQTDSLPRQLGRIPAWNGWGADVQNTRFQSAESARLRAVDIPRLKLKWAFGFPNSASAYAQPAVVFGRIYVGTDTGYVYSLDAMTGCVRWSTKIGYAVRTAMTIGAIHGQGTARYAVFFGDVKANAYALDARTGRLLWATRIEQNVTNTITAAPTFYRGRLYVPVSSWEEIGAADLSWECCKSVGAVASVDANTGRVLWKTYVIAERPQPLGKNVQGVQQWGPAGGSVWNSPTVDPVRHAVYVGTGDATTYPASATSDSVIALEMDTGRVLWAYQVHKNDSFLGGCGSDRPSNCPKIVGPDWDIPASPVLSVLRGGQRRLIVGTKPGDLLALDPDHGGALVWRMNLLDPNVAPDASGIGDPSGIMWGFATDRDNAYIGSGRGGVVAVKLATGTRVWSNPLESAHKVSYASANTGTPGVVIQGGSNGKLHALSTVDGHQIWSFETMREFDTVNKVKAKGGSISVGGPVVAGGMLFVESGYALQRGTPGNVLLAFAVH